MTGYCDYLFLLQPSDVVKHQIRYCKLKASQHIGGYKGMHATAHISICELGRKKPSFIKSYIDAVRDKIHSVPPVTLETNGFNFFAHADKHMTIYAAIKPTYKIDNWFALLKQQLNDRKPMVPHITVTRYINIDDFYKLWPELRLVGYQEKFTADRLTILQKETFKPNAKYEILEEIYFKNELKSRY
jgi:2'-5' RNA ligase